jgi:glutathione S-transferase
MHILYGMPGSLYTAKVRSYLRKRGLSYVERPVGDPHFQTEIVPKLGRFIMPAVVTPDGSLLQDGADIITALEAGAPSQTPAVPIAPVLQVLALFLELFGGEGLLRPAMHFRWNFDETNLRFLKNDFCAALAPQATQEGKDAIFAMASRRMRKAAESFGVTPQAIPAIEASYAAFLSCLETHLNETPFLLGGYPTVADYGFIGPLFAHLARDPYPSMLMKQTAPAVWRWVERMNAPDAGTGEHIQATPTLFDAANLPPSLLGLLHYIAEEYASELEAQVQYANAWLADHPDLVEGTNGCKRPSDRSIGAVTFDWRGQPLTVQVLFYRFYLLQRVRDTHAAAAQADQQAIKAMLATVGLERILTLKTHRRVERRNLLEVWGPRLMA